MTCYYNMYIKDCIHNTRVASQMSTHEMIVIIKRAATYCERACMSCCFPVTLSSQSLTLIYPLHMTKPPQSPCREDISASALPKTAPHFLLTMNIMYPSNLFHASECFSVTAKKNFQQSLCQGPCLPSMQQNRSYTCFIIPAPLR